MELDAIRNELNKYDEAIRTLVTLRMSLIPIVADIKVKNDLPLFQGKREDEIYKKIEIFSRENGINEVLLKDIYKLIIAEALRLEKIVADNPDYSANIADESIVALSETFEKLDVVISKTIPELISKIQNSTELKGLTLTEKSTIYYNEKVNKTE